MTLTYSEIMVRYGELSTKGKNRMRFINKLRNNIKDVLSIYPDVKVTFESETVVTSTSTVQTMSQ